MDSQLYFLQRLNREFDDRKQKNPRYSLRAFANFLEIDPSSLSKVLNKKRNLSSNDALRIAKILKLDADEFHLFFSSVLDRKGRGYVENFDQSLEVEHYLDEEFDYKAIVEWEYFAVLNLMNTHDFMADEDWIAQRLGISVLKAYEVWNGLIEHGMIQKDENDRYFRTHKKITTSDGKLSKALQLAHLNELDLTAQKVTEVPVNKRDLFSFIIPTNTKQLDKAKKLTREYCKNMERLLEDGERDEVYLLGVQLTPMSERREENV